ncbi:hypothetical protein GCM10010261_17670 [Streptomyces pilosus]|nr:hypothetical protein GCM10010261_17670 [Streptomyces pilosus]
MWAAHMRIGSAMGAEPVRRLPAGGAARDRPRTRRDASRGTGSPPAAQTAPVGDGCRWCGPVTVEGPLASIFSGM